jgi:hypothetical protein
MNQLNANIQTEESIEKMLKVIDSVTLADSGKYLTYEGGTFPR